MPGSSQITNDIVKKVTLNNSKETKKAQNTVPEQNLDQFAC